MTIGTYSETQRPAIHFTPPAGWLNDPNGLIYADGKWHLFYQHHPHSNVWGPMHWGHAVSTDLLTWEHLPVALEPDELGNIFSGTVVVDHEGVAGYGSGTMLAFFTYDGDAGQRQGLAYSHDGGRSWHKHVANPILDEPEVGPDFRDPKVLWYEPPVGAGWWVMLVAAGPSLRFYRSDDLLSWSFVSSFDAATTDDLGVVETPDLFELPVDGGPQRRWVLSVGHLTGGPAGGSGARYLLGSFDGTRFSPDGVPSDVRWTDHGADFYAAQSWTDAQDDRRVWIGWMNNWAYANTVPATGWRGMMSTPRELELRTGHDGIQLHQRPVRELTARRRQLVRLDHPSPQQAADALAGIRAHCLDVELILDVEPGATALVGVVLDAGPDSLTTIALDPGSSELLVDRGQTEATFRHDSPRVHRAPLTLTDQRLTLRLVVDSHSIEVFADDGRLVISELVFLDGDRHAVSLTGVPAAGNVVRLSVFDVPHQRDAATDR